MMEWYLGLGTVWKAVVFIAAILAVVFLLDEGNNLMRRARQGAPSPARKKSAKPEPESEPPRIMMPRRAVSGTPEIAPEEGHTRSFEVVLRGITSDRTDNMPSQDLVRYLYEGSPVWLVVDGNGIKPRVSVKCEEGVIGTIPKEKAAGIAGKIRAGRIVDAEIGSIQEGLTADGWRVGIRLTCVKTGPLSMLRKNAK